MNCERQGEVCDYSIRLNWGGRSKKGSDDWNINTNITSSPHSSIFPTPEALGISIGSPTPSATYSEPGGRPGHSRKRSNLSLPPEEPSVPPIDPSIYRGDNGPTSAPLDSGFRQDLGGFDSGAMLLENFRQRHAPQSQNHRDITSAPIDPRIESLGIRASPNFPSPGSTSLRSPGAFGDNIQPPNLNYERSGTPNSASLPPFSSISGPHSPFESPLHDFGDQGEHQAKRMRFSPKNDRSPDARFLQPAVEDSMLYGRDTSSMQSAGNFTFNFAVPHPLTPGNGLDDGGFQVPQPPVPVTAQEEPRRLSVQDLLSAPPPDDILTPQTPDSWPGHDADTTPYGYDLGMADEDVPKNKDSDAIRVIGSPEAKRLVFPSGYFVSEGDDGEDETKDRPIAFNRGGYYAKPVAIRIHKSLEPLPQKLMENPMNLLYFHHFLNHTARLLVPHDCEQNPFRNVLPQSISSPF